ncbi:MAG: amidinotransferase [Candidatus Aminicenantes bacterium]|nr:amidinotransferase [Candidatus Aminicenantes bacterium]
MIRNEGETLRRVIVCAPRREYFKVEKPEIHNIGEPADKKKALSQHLRLQAVLRAAGARVTNLKEFPGHPNSVFSRDAGLVTPRGFIKLRPGLPTRRGEEDWMASALARLGVRRFGAIEPPGTVEGGDVILAGKVTFVGLSERSNKSGVRQLSRLLMSMDYEVRIMTLPSPHLHIGGAMSVVGPRVVICCRGIFPKGFFDGFKVIEIPCLEDTGANVIALGKGRVIVEKSGRDAAAALKKAGFKVRLIDLSEFVKGRGGPTCLIMPVERWE